MMVLSAAQIRDCEAWTMQWEPVASIDLMERAAEAFVAALCRLLDLSDYHEIAVFVGAGNNGGDGLAIARLLLQRKVSVTVVKCFGTARLSANCQVNLQRLEELSSEGGKYRWVDGARNFQSDGKTLAIDALFGIGLSREIKDDGVVAVDKINACSTVVAVDVPSGLFVDQHTPKSFAVVQAEVTLTFQYMKLAFLLPENASRVGQCKVLDIGIQRPDGLQPSAELIHASWLRPLMKRPQKFDHKGTNGCGLLVAGSDNMPGAAVLAAKAALRAGIGKVVVHTSARAASALMAHLPEAVLDLDGKEAFSNIYLEKIPPFQAMAVGPGLGTSQMTLQALKNLLDEVACPLVLDADALNMLASEKTWLAFLPKNSILTPHFKEFERLAGKSENDFERLEKLSRVATHREVIVILKGAYTAVAMPDGRMFFNVTGNPGMATAGSGDVLTGILLACLAKGYPAQVAACLSVYLHGLAGDLALNEQSCESLIASDIIHFLGAAFKHLETEIQS